MAEANGPLNQVNTETFMRLKLLASVCLAALFPFFSGCGSSADKEFDRHLSYGKKFFEASEFPEAYREYRSAVRIKPESAEGHYGLGLSYLNMGGPSNSVSAFREFTKAVELDSSHKGARVKLAELYLSSRNFEQALKLAESVYNESGDQEARMLMAGALAGKKDYEKALSIMEELLRVNPGTSRPYMVAASIYSASGDDERAEMTLKRAVAADPEDFNARAAIASLYHRQKKALAAENELRKAAAEVPERLKLKALSALANFHIAAGKLDEAEKTLKEALRESGDRMDGYLLLGGFYSATNRPADAESVYAEGVSRFPGVLTLRKKYAELLLDRGKETEAEPHIKEISKTDPTGYYSLYLTGRLKAARGQFIEAQGELQESIKEEPSFPMSHYTLGLVYKATRNYEQAKASLGEALRLNPGLTGAKFALASAHMLSGDGKQALSELERLLDKYPGYLPANLAAGSIHIKSGEPEKAEKYFTAAAESGDSNGYAGLGSVSMMRGEVKKALGYFEKALSLDQSNIEALSNVTGIYVSSGQSGKAAEMITRQMTASPDDARLHFLLGKAAAGTDEETAQKSFRKAAELRGDFAEPRIELGRLYAKKGEYDEAASEWKEALKADPASLPACMLLALMNQEQKKWDEAASWYAKSLEIDPRFAPAANNLAWLYLEQGQPDRALPYAERAKEAMPDDPVISDTLGWVYYNKGAYLKAVSLLKDSVKKNPENAGARYHLGMTYFKRGQLKDAKAELAKALKDKKKFAGSAEAVKVLKELEKKNR